MGIRESLLNTITSVGSSDFVRIVTSAGVSSKATLQNVIKSFETGLGAKSSLGTSDYVRVVGSDNAAYKQSLSSLMDTMGVTRTLISNGVDLNTLLPNANSGTGYYRGDSISTMTNKPSDEVNAFPWALDAINVSSYIKQILHVYTAQANIVVYERIQRYSSGSIVWGNWEKIPTRAEINALNSKTFTTLTKSTSVDTFEYYVYKYGSLFMGYIVFKPSNDIVDNGEIVSAGVPTLISAMQLPITCVAGTQAGQTGRCRIGNGKIVSWYSAMSLKAGNTYLIPVNTLCA